MIIICNTDEEHASALSALEVINTLRRQRPKTVRPPTDDKEWVRTRWARPEYL